MNARFAPRSQVSVAGYGSGNARSTFVAADPKPRSTAVVVAVTLVAVFVVVATTAVIVAVRKRPRGRRTAVAVMKVTVAVAVTAVELVVTVAMGAAVTAVVATARAHRSREHVRLRFPARRPRRVRRRHDAQRQTAAVRYVTLFGVRRLYVQPVLVLEHRVHHHAEGQCHLRLVMIVQLSLVQQASRAQHHRYVARPADGRLDHTTTERDESDSKILLLLLLLVLQVLMCQHAVEFTTVRLISVVQVADYNIVLSCDVVRRKEARRLGSFR